MINLLESRVLLTTFSADLRLELPPKIAFVDPHSPGQGTYEVAPAYSVAFQSVTVQVDSSAIRLTATQDDVSVTVNCTEVLDARDGHYISQWPAPWSRVNYVSIVYGEYGVFSTAHGDSLGGVSAVVIDDTGVPERRLSFELAGPLFNTVPLMGVAYEPEGHYWGQRFRLTGRGMEFSSAPDLSVTTTFDGTITKMKPFWIEGRVRNGGSLRSEASRLAFFLSDDALLSDDDSEVGSVRLPSISPGGSRPFRNSLTVRSGSAGACFLIVVADPRRALEEENESNNSQSVGTTLFELSGEDWSSRFSGSTSLKKLEANFRGRISSFLSSLESAGVKGNVIATYRPPQRAYLMHWSYRIERDGLSVKPPFYDGVFIDWDHGDAVATKQAAGRLRSALGVDRSLEIAPSLRSNHIRGLAADISFRYVGSRSVTGGDGKQYVLRASKKRPGNSADPVLIQIAASFGVIHYVNVLADINHWSTDGR